jgi:amidase
MFAPPTIEEILEIAARLGLSLGAEDAALLQGPLVDQLAGMDAFLQARVDEERPPLLVAERAPGHRPSAAEDPLGAWLWRCRIEGPPGGLLTGATVSFKDHVSVAGIPLTFGTSVLDGFVPDVDATVATRVLQAGATIIGKNTHHGFAGLRSLGGGLGDYWDAVNPHDPARQTGGSSSGSAVAVAAGDVDIAFGGDQGGSVRHPAAYCGVVGLKPTYGLVSHMGAAYGGEPSIDHLGPLARTVRDAATALQAVAGYDGYDPRQGREVPDAIDALGGLEDGVEGLSIGVVAEGFAEPIDAEVRDSVHAAIEVLRRAGARIVELSIPEHATVTAAAGALQVSGLGAMRTNATGVFPTGAHAYLPQGITTAIDRAWTAKGDQMAGYLKLTWILGELSRRRFHGAVYAKAQNARRVFMKAYDRALDQVDVLALPTCPVVAPEVGPALDHAAAWRREIDVLAEVFPSFRNVQPFNYTGHPAIAVPCGPPGALPHSLQLVGRAFADPLVLRVAHAYEQTR